MLTSVFLQDAVIAVVGPVDDFGLRIESRTRVFLRDHVWRVGLRGREGHSLALLSL